jgi:hypothetical protein
MKVRRRIQLKFKDITVPNRNKTIHTLVNTFRQTVVTGQQLKRN